MVFLEEVPQIVQRGVFRHAEGRSDHYPIEPGIFGGEEQVVHAKHAGQPVLSIYDIHVLHVIIGVLATLGFQVFEYVLNGLMTLVGEELGDH